MKVLCYGVRKAEETIFNELNKDFKYDLTFTEELLNEKTTSLAKGFQAVILMVNCIANKKALDEFKSYGVEYLLTRTVGTNHIDIEHATKLGFKMGNVPAYSPNAISELAFSLGFSMLRNNFFMYQKFSEQEFNVFSEMLSQEARFSTIGIIGTGRIGYETAKAWKGTGANVIGYDIYKNDKVTDVIEYKELDELLKNSDVISLHLPYIPGPTGNYHFIDAEKIKLMKKGVVIVNTARGELIDVDALLKGLESEQIGKAALDVVENEQNLFFNKWNNNIPNETLQKLVDLKPRVIITPHISYFTTEAVKNMVDCSFNNLKELIENGECKNPIKLNK